MRTIIGIDPGLSGALCILRASGDITFYTWEDIFDLTYDPCPVFIESQVASPRQKGAGTTMKNYGKLLGFFKGINGVWPTEVKPSVWYKYYKTPAGLKDRDRKEWTALNMTMMYPNAELMGPRGGLKDGCSDALAIANYGLKYSAS